MRSASILIFQVLEHLNRFGEPVGAKMIDELDKQLTDRQREIIARWTQPWTQLRRNTGD